MAVSVKVNMAGVREVLKSSGVKSLLQTEVDAAAARCNGLVKFHTPMRDDAYSAKVVEGNYTSVGRVSMNRLGEDGLAVAYEDAAHNTLLKGCGW